MWSFTDNICQTLAKRTRGDFSHVTRNLEEEFYRAGLVTEKYSEHWVSAPVILCLTLMVTVWLPQLQASHPHTIRGGNN